MKRTVINKQPMRFHISSEITNLAVPERVTVRQMWNSKSFISLTYI